MLEVFEILLPVGILMSLCLWYWLYVRKSSNKRDLRPKNKAVRP